MQELLIIAGVFVVLFGATKLPQIARSVGQSARVFRAETRGMKDDEEAAKKDREPTDTSSPQQLSSPPSNGNAPAATPVEQVPMRDDDARSR